jgi:hypothetical protein
VNCEEEYGHRENSERRQLKGAARSDGFAHAAALYQPLARV